MKLLLFVGIIAVTLAIGESFDCYDCRNCPDPFNKDSAKIVTCDERLPVCVKLVSELDKNKLVIRSCVETTLMRSSVESSGVERIWPEITTMYACEENLCNGALSTKSVSILFSILTVITMKLIQ